MAVSPQQGIVVWKQPPIPLPAKLTHKLKSELSKSNQPKMDLRSEEKEITVSIRTGIR